MFNIVGDEDGNMWAIYADATSDLKFESDDDGNIYMIVSDDEEGVSA